MATALYIVEARDEEGRVVPGAPFATASTRQLEEYYTEETGDYMASFGEVLDWFLLHGIHCRVRPW